MSRAARRQKSEQQLRLLEEQFTENLIAALKRCASGEWGVFGQNDNSIAHEPSGLILKSHEAESLMSQGTEIMRLRQALGIEEDFPLFQRYLYYRELRGSNTPGEPKLALQFLSELGV